METRDPAELDPETFVASRVVLAQPPMKVPPALPGMTPRLRIGIIHIGTGPTCPRCRCGLKEST